MQFRGCVLGLDISPLAKIVQATPNKDYKKTEAPACGTSV
jgi:hypothetical protein